MAATWIRPLHVNKGKSIAKTLSLRTDYAMNPDKTDGGSLVISYGCDPRTVDAICCKGRFLRTPTKSIAARPSVAVWGGKAVKEAINHEVANEAWATSIPSRIVTLSGVPRVLRGTEPIAFRDTKGKDGTFHALAICEAMQTPSRLDSNCDLRGGNVCN